MRGQGSMTVRPRHDGGRHAFAERRDRGLRHRPCSLPGGDHVDGLSRGAERRHAIGQRGRDQRVGIGGVDGGANDRAGIGLQVIGAWMKGRVDQ
jgi:hypothetical protein